MLNQTSGSELRRLVQKIIRRHLRVALQYQINPTPLKFGDGSCLGLAVLPILSLSLPLPVVQKPLQPCLSPVLSKIFPSEMLPTPRPNSDVKWLEARHLCPRWMIPGLMFLGLGRMLVRRPRVSAFLVTFQASCMEVIRILLPDHGKQKDN